MVLYLLLFKKFKKYIKEIMLITSFVFGFILGQPSARFFLEPMIWVYLTLNHAHSIIKIPKIFDKLLKPNL